MKTQNNLKINEISKATKISRQYISKILKKKVANPGIQTLRKLAAAMNIPFEELGY